MNCLDNKGLTFNTRWKNSNLKAIRIIIPIIKTFSPYKSGHYKILI